MPTVAKPKGAQLVEFLKWAVAKKELNVKDFSKEHAKVQQLVVADNDNQSLNIF